MSFSPEWELIYKDKAHWSVWPWSDVISLFYRFCRDMLGKDPLRVFEFGCGPGANIIFFSSLGAEYFSIDGSDSAIAAVHKRFPDLKDNILIGDFSLPHSFGRQFDVVVDRASITHNDTKSIQRCLMLAHEYLKPGGIFIGVDWFSTLHADFQNGIRSEDVYTRDCISKGPFSGIGKVHFSDESHLRALFSNFEILFLEEKVLTRREPEGSQFASWNIVSRRSL